MKPKSQSASAKKTKLKPKHIPMDQFSVIDGELHIGDIAITQLATKIGDTPFYAYDRKIIKEKIDLLRNSLPQEIHIHYAIKANPMNEVVNYMATLVDGFDLASAGELEIALNTNMPRQHISIAGPGKTDVELRRAIEAEIVINMESESEMQRIANIANDLNITPRVAIRVNPDFELKSSGMKMGGGSKPFGIDAERIPQMMTLLGKLRLQFYGLHIFCGSQNLKHDNIIEAHNKTFELALRLLEHAPCPPKSLNIGGGLGIPYFPGDQKINLAPIKKNLHRLLPKFKLKHPQTEIVMELGRFLVGECGIYVCKIIDKKVSRGETFLITNGGLHHHLAASGNFGQIIRKNYPVMIGNNVSDGVEKVNIVGPLCTPLDIIASQVELPKAVPGDLVVIFQSGAYGLSASPINFLSQPLAAEILL